MDLEEIYKWAEKRQELRKKKKKKFPVKYIIVIIFIVVAIVIIWLIVNHTFKKNKDVYVDLDTGNVIDIDEERKMGTEIIYET